MYVTGENVAVQRVGASYWGVPYVIEKVGDAIAIVAGARAALLHDGAVVADVDLMPGASIGHSSIANDGTDAMISPHAVVPSMKIRFAGTATGKSRATVHFRR